MAAIYLGLSTLVAEFGLGPAGSAVRELSVAQINQLNGLAVLLGLASLVASCAVAIPLGRFFDAPQLPLVVAAMSTTFVITSFKTVPLALLQRELRFKALALIDLGQALVLAISMIVLAAAGLRYWTRVGLALVARDFVLAVLGSKWEATIAPLQILAAYGAVRSITPLLPQVLHTIRDTKFEMWTMVAAAVVMPTSFFVSGQRWGTVGLAMAWVVMDPLIAILLYVRVFSKIALSPRAYLVALWPALSGTLLMAAVVLAVGWL